MTRGAEAALQEMEDDDDPLAVIICKACLRNPAPLENLVLAPEPPYLFILRQQRALEILLGERSILVVYLLSPRP